MAELTDLALCDEGLDYFQFADALGALKENGHVHQNGDGLLSITDKGRVNCAICAKELPYSVRTKCDRNTQELNGFSNRGIRSAPLSPSCPTGRAIRWSWCWMTTPATS